MMMIAIKMMINSNQIKYGDDDNDDSDDDDDDDNHDDQDDELKLDLN